MVSLNVHAGYVIEYIASEELQTVFSRPVQVIWSVYTSYKTISCPESLISRQKFAT